jgi:phenylacetate-CoA ligase
MTSNTQPRLLSCVATARSVHVCAASGKRRYDMRYNAIDAIRLRRITRRKEYGALCDIHTASELQEFQEDRLKALLLHAYANVPYYHRVFGEIGLVHGNAVDMSKFDRIPVLTKDILRRFTKELISHDYQTRGWYCDTSGGSTGEPVRVMKDATFARWSTSVDFYYYKHVLGIEEPIAKRVILWGSERDFFEGGAPIQARLKNRARHSMFLNSFRMSESDLELYIRKINAYRPELIRGYAHSLFELCDYAARKKRRLHTPKVVVSAAELLTEGMRQVIESAFKTHVFDFYGSREVGGLAGECTEGTMHQFAFLNHLEVLDPRDQPVGTNDEGRVVVTNLASYAMPLIRYDMGDTVARTGVACSCGSPLPTLRNVTGRVGDHFITKNGAIIEANYFGFLFDFRDSIRKFQMIQEDYERIRIKVALRSDLTASDRDDIEKKIRFAMGDCEILWDIVDDIPDSASGKHLFIRSLMWR